MPRPHETDIRVLESTFPSGHRDFCFFRIGEQEQWQPVHAIDLLALDRAVHLIDKVATGQLSLAQNLALGRLLVPCLRYRGSRRHLVTEQWTVDDLHGDILSTETRTRLACRLADKQAEDWRLITTGRKPPAGSLAEVFWETHTELPWLEARFDDPELGRFAKALHQHLVGEGADRVEVDWAAVARKVEQCRRSDFAPLNLGSGRRYRKTFRKLLAVAVRWSSQLTGAVAHHLVSDRLKALGERELTVTERTMLDFRYGAVCALGDINVSFLGNAGSMMAHMVNFLFVLHATGAPERQRAEAERCLHNYVDLLRCYQRRRKDARAAERRENRQRYARPMPDGRKGRNPEWEQDATAATAEAELEKAEEIRWVTEEILSRLKPRDAERVRAWLDAEDDREEAAKTLGMSREQFNRIWRQTTRPNVMKVVEQLRREDPT